MGCLPPPGASLSPAFSAPALLTTCAYTTTTTTTRALQNLPGVSECDADAERLCPHSSSLPVLGVMRDCLHTFLDAEREGEAGGSGVSSGASQGQTSEPSAGAENAGEQEEGTRVGEPEGGDGGEGEEQADEEQEGEARLLLLQEDGDAEQAGDVADDDNMAEEGGMVDEGGVAVSDGDHPEVHLSPQCRAFLEVRGGCVCVCVWVGGGGGGGGPGHAQGGAQQGSLAGSSAAR